MSRVLEQGRYVSGAKLDFSGLYAAIRANKPKCVVCDVSLQESITGVRTRVSDEGKIEKMCRACAVAELAENIVQDLPR